MRREGLRRLFALVLGVALVLTFAGYAIFRGLGPPDVPSDAIAVVDGAPNGTILQSELKQEIAIASLNAQLQSVPKPGSPQYQTVQNQAISDLIGGRWLAGEAAERDLTVSDADVQNRLKGVVQQFGGQQKFNAFLKRYGLSQDFAATQIKLGLLGSALQRAVEAKPTVSVSEAQDVYDHNPQQYKQPASRDFRLILNKSRAQVEQAKAALSKDDSPASWKKVAAQYSTDPTTKSSGGLRTNVTQGQSEPALDKAAFSAPQGQLVGPVKGQNGYYLIEVEKITSAGTTPFSKAESQIEQQLRVQKQQVAAQAFQTRYADKWRSRTFCSESFMSQAASSSATQTGSWASQCENYSGPKCSSGQIRSVNGTCVQEGNAPVPSTAPSAPGCLLMTNLRGMCDTGGAAPLLGLTPPGTPQGPLGPPASGRAGASSGIVPVQPGQSVPGQSAPPTSTTPGG